MNLVKVLESLETQAYGSLRIGDHAAAELAFTKALNLLGDRAPPALFNDLAATLLTQGKLHSAKAMVEQGLRCFPENNRLTTNLGIVQYCLNDFKGCAETLGALTEFTHPDPAFVLLKLAQSYVLTGKLTELGNLLQHRLQNISLFGIDWLIVRLFFYHQTSQNTLFSALLEGSRETISGVDFGDWSRLEEFLLSINFINELPERFSLQSLVSDKDKAKFSYLMGRRSYLVSNRDAERRWFLLAESLYPQEKNYVYKAAFSDIHVGKLESGFARLSRLSTPGRPRQRGKDYIFNLLSTNSSLHIVFEQGVGDQLVYLQILGCKELTHLHDRLVLYLDSRLRILLKRYFPTVSVKSTQDYERKLRAGKRAGFISCVEFMSLFVGKRFDPDFWDQRPIFSRERVPDSTKVAARSDKISLKIGCFWRSLDRWDNVKSLPAAAFFSFFEDRSKYQFFDLNYLTNNSEGNLIPNDVKLTDPKIDQVSSFESLILFADEVDVFVGVSNSTAHLLASIGKPLVVLKPSSPFFYWDTDSKNHWYPTANCIKPKSLRFDELARLASDSFE